MNKTRLLSGEKKGCTQHFPPVNWRKLGSSAGVGVGLGLEVGLTVGDRVTMGCEVAVCVLIGLDSVVSVDVGFVANFKPIAVA